MSLGNRFQRCLACAAVVLVAGCTQTDEEPNADATEVAVRVASVVRATLHRYVDAYGSVVPEPAAGDSPGGATDLAAPASGIVRAVLVREGDRVRAGDLVVRLEDRMAKADVDRATARVLFAEQTLARELKLFDQQNTSARQVEEARQTLELARADSAVAGAALDQVRLRSPIDGIVSRIRVLPGQSVDANSVVAEIVNTRRLVVSARVAATEIATVRNGQSVIVWAESADSSGVEGSVSFVGPSIDPASGTALVRVKLPPDAGLAKGRFVRVRIVVDECAACLAVPIESVFTSVDGTTTLSIVDGDTAHRMEVSPGIRDGGLIGVDGANLAEGMTVVTTGSYALPESTRVRIMGDGEL